MCGGFWQGFAHRSRTTIGISISPRMCQDVPGWCQDEIEIADWPVPGLICPGTKNICLRRQIFYVPGQNDQSLITRAKLAKTFETLSNSLSISLSNSAAAAAYCCSKHQQPAAAGVRSQLLAFHTYTQTSFFSEFTINNSSSR